MQPESDETRLVLVMSAKTNNSQNEIFIQIPANTTKFQCNLRTIPNSSHISYEFLAIEILPLNLTAFEDAFSLNEQWIPEP